MQDANLSKEAVTIIKQNEKIMEFHKRELKAQQIVDEFCKNGKNDRYNIVFRMIDETISCSAKDQFIYEMPIGTKLYRARIVKDAEIRKNLGISVDSTGAITGFNEQESMEPPLGKGAAGRNNIAGMSYLYVADEEATACVEVKAIPKDPISLAEVKTKKKLRIYCLPDGMYTTPEDDSPNLGAIITEIMMLFYRPVSNEDDYKATQVISNYIRKMGFDGFSHRSFYTGKRNYTIFNSHPANFEFVGSRMVVSQGYVQYFWDQNNHRCIEAGLANIDYRDNHSADVLTFIKEKLEEKNNSGDIENSRDY